jgi:hypothetical protein
MRKKGNKNAMTKPISKKRGRLMGMASDSIFRRYAIADSAIQLAAQKKVARFRKQA